MRASLDAAGRAQTRLGISVLGLLIAATWALSHSYLGLYHDAELYTLQALAHLHPASASAAAPVAAPVSFAAPVSQDVFLKFGSQDRFTIFSSIYAGLGRFAGVENAAAALTLISQLALLLAAYLLARVAVGGSMALLGVGILVAIPGDYGADRIFTCIESFLTPRMAAEALVLGSLAAALSSRKSGAAAHAVATGPAFTAHAARTVGTAPIAASVPIVAAVLVATAALIHPVMASAGMAALLCLYVAIPRPKAAAALVALGLSATGLLAVLGGAISMPTGLWGQFDHQWLQIVSVRSPYLFLGHWHLDDWARVAVTMTTLIVGIVAVPAGDTAPDDNVVTDRDSAARTLCIIGALTVAGGLGLTLFACDLLHMVLFTQLQPWRWQWLGVVIAALLLPQIGCSLWAGAGGASARHTSGDGAARQTSRSGGVTERSASSRFAGRTTALLLAAAWVFASNEYALAAAVAALVSLPLLHRLKANEAKLIFWGACGLLAIALIWRVASNLEFTDAYYYDRHIPVWIRRAMSFFRDGTAPAAAMLLAYWLMQARWSEQWRMPPQTVHDVAATPTVVGTPTVADRPMVTDSPTVPGRLTVLAVLTVVAVITIGFCAALLPQTWRSWTTREFPPQQVARFAPLRAQLGGRSEVFWPDSPLGVWLLLDRPSYISVIQTSGMVFSRQSALELARRADALGAIVPSNSFMRWNSAGVSLSKQQLKAACDTKEFDFLVTSADLGDAPVAAVTSGSGAGSGAIRLYRCRGSDG